MVLEILVVDDKYASDIGAHLTHEFDDKVVPYPIKYEDEAIELVKERGYDLVILDYNLNEKNGPEVAKEMLAIRPGLRIAGYSDYWNNSNSEDAGLDTHFRERWQVKKYVASILKNNMRRPPHNL